MGRHEQDDDEAEAQRRLREDLEAREETAPAGTEPLPPGVTHEVDEKDRVHRRRFSAS